VRVCWGRCVLETTKLLTEALYFANEVYASEGAVLHATQGIQTGKKWQKANVKFVVHLTPEQYMQSYHENMGDALHSLNHYEALNKPYAVFRAGKYIERMLVAGEALPGMKDLLRKHAKYKKLKPLADRAAQVKSSADGDDPLIIASEKDFNRIVKKADLNQLKAENIKTLQQAILELGAYLPDRAGL